MVPQTAFQIGVMLLLVVPGFVYTGTRRYFRGGATADEKDFSVRLVHGIAASVMLNCLYLVTVGPWLAEIVRTDSGNGLSAVVARPQLVGAVLILLAVIVPVALAAVVTWVRGRDKIAEKLDQLPFSPTPSAWDRIAPKRVDCFVRVRTADGHWVGGYVTEDAYFSTYPEPRDLFIPEQWEMDKDGRFVSQMMDSLGVFVPLTGAERISWFRAPDQPSPPELGGGRRGGGGIGSF